MQLQNLLDMISQAQGGQATQNLGNQFGLDQQQTNSALESLLPSFSSGIKKNVSQPQGLEALLGALQKGNHAQQLDDPSHFQRPEAIDDGNNILGHIFGSKDVSRNVAQRASQKSGVDSGILKQMLPLIASMVMGSMGKQTQQPQFQQQFGGGQQQSSGGGGLLGSLVGGLLGGGQQQQQGGMPNLGGLEQMFQADSKGSEDDGAFDLSDLTDLLNRR